ncbi:MAG: oxygen-independent coproporphyrinogen III oxidase [Rhodoferax sp.]
MNAAAITAPPDLNNDLLKWMTSTSPCYTSFPCADRFVEAFSANEYRQALELRRCGPAITGRPMSLNVNIPFCETQCYFCTSSTVVTRQHGHAASYLKLLTREVELHTAVLGGCQAVNQLHLGGGTPTFFSDTELGDLMQMLRRHFKFLPGGDYTIEIDPRTVNASRLDALVALGFNRLSIGVQDLDTAVQKAVHRVQPAQDVAQLFHDARQRHFDSINVDLMHGLPHQSPESFKRTLSEVLAWAPDRIALYAYEHQPAYFKPQRHIATEALPSNAARQRIHANAVAALLSAGYVFVGVDHFALPTDALAIAKRQGRLHRNFQGFSPQPDCDLIGLGLSARGRIGACYSQNAKTLEAYTDRLKQGLFPVVSGIALTRDDLIRRAIIMALMCQGEVSFEAVELGYLIDFRHYFAAEFALLTPFVHQGWVVVDEAGIQVTGAGLYGVRAVAMVFDRYRQADHARARFSKVI